MSTPVLLNVESISKQFGARPLFEGLSLTIHEGDHIGLVGPNGSGKSTLLKILAGLELPDSGNRALRRNVRVGYVPQDPIFTPGKSPEDVILQALEGESQLEDYEKDLRVAVALSRSGFDERAQSTDTLSGGWRKRLAIARELALEPDVLLLDEPTNHLDVEAILWLEALLKSEPEAFVVVSHDRYFLENITRRMIELNPTYAEGMLQVDGTYSDLLEKRDEVLKNQASYQETLANLVRREVEWLRRGPKARTTKSKARIHNAEGLIEELDQSRARSAVSTAGIDFTSSERKTKRLLVATGVSKSFDGKKIVEGLDLLLTAGARLGILGPNGSGKTTLLRMLTGEIEPDKGVIERADRLRVAYFEQNRESLSPELTLRRALSPEGDTVIFNERPMHIAAWAARFLFRSEQLQTSVSRLSGGEKARIVLARLMLQPADLLVLDEPTNDLDIPTLDVLEESLLEFPGAIVLVTHDRFLLDRVSTSILALDGDGGASLFADYSQWEANRRTPSTPARPGGATASGGSTASSGGGKTKTKRLSWKEQQEWDGMEATLVAAEQRLERARKQAEDPAVASDAAALQRRFSELAAAQHELDRLFARWAELEAKVRQ
jgi:ABC transport system ATP-binding/permease protein